MMMMMRVFVSVSWICDVSVFGLGFAHDQSLHTLKQMSHAFIIPVPSLGIVVGSRRFCLFVFLLFVCL